MTSAMKPKFFSTPDEFRNWLERNHESESELLVGFYKKNSGWPSMTWPESVEEALCFGWIDGIRRKIDGDSYSIRFSPRRPDSNWSAINVQKVQELKQTGRMKPAGLRIFEERKPGTTDRYSFEQKTPLKLPPEFEAQLRGTPAAWSFFESQPPGYRKTVTWWILSAKQETTRQRRLQTLIDDSKEGLRIKPLRQ